MLSYCFLADAFALRQDEKQTDLSTAKTGASPLSAPAVASTRLAEQPETLSADQAEAEALTGARCRVRGRAGRPTGLYKAVMTPPESELVNRSKHNIDVATLLAITPCSCSEKHAQQSQVSASWSPKMYHASTRVVK